MNELTQRGINAMKANDRASARKLLAAALQQEPNDATAWLWLAAAVDTPGQRIDCLRQVLKIDPTNQAALKGMAALGVPASEIPGAEQSIEAFSQPAPTPEPVAVPQPVVGDAPEQRLQEVLRVTEPSAQAAPVPLEQISARPQPASAVPPVAVVRPARRAAVSEENARMIFKTRPSNIPALLSFWVFFFGALYLGSQVNGLNPGGTFQSEGFLEGMPFAMFGLLFALALGLVLELVVLFVIIRNMRTHYELTSASLTVPFRGRRARVPVHEIYSVECHQSFFQRLYGAGDILLDAAVEGELARVRLRSVPGCQKRAEEISYLIQDTTVSQPVG